MRKTWLMFTAALFALIAGVSLALLPALALAETAVSAASQGDTGGGAVGVDPICLVFGALISVVVGVFKRIPFIGKNPKTVALILNSVVALSPVLIKGAADFKAIFPQIVACIITQLSVSVATHEVVIKTVVPKDR